VQVTVALLALLALGGFVIDYGVMWASRGQAQNSADAGALSGALALAFDNPTGWTGARAKAKAVAQRNRVWGQSPDITDADITFPPCPPGASGVPDTCVKVDVFRNQRPGGNPLPTFLTRLVGITEQGVRATATAQIFAGDKTKCVKPWAIPDKWQEFNPTAGPWQQDSEFTRYVQTGNNAGALTSPADVYIRPGQPGHSGMTVEADYGQIMTLKFGLGSQSARPGLFWPVVLTPGEVGGAAYENNISRCNQTAIGPGTILAPEPGAKIGPTAHGMADLIAQDSAARWDPLAEGGRGAIVGGCMAAGTCGISPRLIALALFDVDRWSRESAGGRGATMEVVKIIGYWVDRMQGNDVVGYITHYPAIATGTSSTDLSQTFLRTVILVR
jgi:hypothetical protein